MSQMQFQASTAAQLLRRGLLDPETACGICLGVGYTMADTVALLGVAHEDVSDAMIRTVRERYVNDELTLAEFEALVEKLV